MFSPIFVAGAKVICGCNFIAPLILLGLIASASATDAAIKRNFGSGMTLLIISNKEINDFMKIIKSLEDATLLIKSLGEKLEIKQRNKKVDFTACY